MILQLRYSIYKPSLQSDPLQEILYSLLTACDNLGALNKVGSPRAKTKPALKSFDLITALLDTWNNIPVVARPQHVRGHQDDRIGPLTFLESLNVRMDLFAKSIAQTHIHNG